MIRSMMVLTTLLVGIAPALAALPPQYQRQTELTAIIAATVDALGIGNPIDAITMTGVDRFDVRGGTCSLTVTVVDVPVENTEPGFAGPRNFKLESSPVVCQ